MSDRTLREDILSLPKEKPLGIILISSKKTCSLCGNGLLVRKDRPSSLVVYDDDMQHSITSTVLTGGVA